MYDLISRGIGVLSEADLFIGNQDLQIGPDLAYSSDLLCEFDMGNALEAIRRV